MQTEAEADGAGRAEAVARRRSRRWGRERVPRRDAVGNADGRRAAGPHTTACDCDCARGNKVCKAGMRPRLDTNASSGDFYAQHTQGS
uniref:Uncharacterized protein n=1 Tax=Plectus sambesii TaxID=2011161 RepID=A0A914XGX5_9BILA